ncbi:hypothetical protein BOTBODRAFT_184989 [Botryobasidium botryosum FD-172 SS1]|uniref:Uncharacterized protein n=1 Tax=Botryobasidium botryosum (strain FD-172 SS1) TaxID=930990 RepID=A0A067MRJ4_BOTB1|nr:hypothetical protein BOTBODRAFT_184989 [Botryobasidium botryosum FD-172 SS1]
MPRGWYSSSYRNPYASQKPKSKPKPKASQAPAVTPQHSLEYAKSDRSKCHGPLPCTNSFIDMHTLRYGEKVVTPQHGEYIAWRHWGCVTPAILAKLKALPRVTHIHGYSDLTATDKKKVQAAIKSGKINPADVPASAKPIDFSHLDGVRATSSQSSSQEVYTQIGAPSTSTGQKRSYEQLQTPPQSSQPAQSSQAPQSSQIIVDSDEEYWNDEVIELEPMNEHYIRLVTNVVGVQYYTGLVGPGEEVILVREPHNKYDKNAIQVLNIARTQVGHIPRNIASQLAPLMDQELVVVEGTIHEGNMGTFTYSMSMSLNIYGAPSMRSQLEPKLKWATPGQRGFTDAMRRQSHASNSSSSRPSSSQASSAPRTTSYSISQSSQRQSSQSQPRTAPAPAALTAAQLQQKKAAQERAERERAEQARAMELQQMLASLEKVQDEGRRATVLDTLCANDGLLEIPEYEEEVEGLSVNLLRHQKQALQWCINRENPVVPKREEDPPVQFWQYKEGQAKGPFYQNLVTKSPQAEVPELGRGALVADAMGLGKTLTMLSLILATREEKSPGFSDATLIVVPLSVLSNWEKQIADHCERDALRYHVYYGPGRNASAEYLKRFDVVITTYQTVVADHVDGASKGASKKKVEIDIDDDIVVVEPSAKKARKANGELFAVNWKRVILDEAHNIRNPKTKVSLAVCALAAERRWAVTGTPIINTPKDLGSILTFLRICAPLNQPELFNRLLQRPLQQGSPEAASLLKALMTQVCLRRTKEMQNKEGERLVPLPPVERHSVPVTLDEETRELYNAVESISSIRVNEMFGEQNTRAPNVAVSGGVLSMLTRLRQLTLHPGLVPASYLEDLKSGMNQPAGNQPAMVLTAQDRLELQAKLLQIIEDNEECAICFDNLKEPRILSCGHPFCLACISEVIARDPKCPMDRRTITMGDLIEPPPPTELTQAMPRREFDDGEDDESGLRTGSSPKIDALIGMLKVLPSADKILVFSQFTSFLDKIAEQLETHEIEYVRFDGRMSAKRRQQVIDDFSVPLQPWDDEVTLSQAPSTSQVINVDSDSDFVLDDDDFIDDDLEYVPRKSKGKGKAKASSQSKGKGKGKAKAPAFSQRSSERNPSVMLISLKAGALGLNLTVANHIFMMDPWWQESIEQQAIDRCNRIGQTKPVHVYHMIAQDTVESRVIDIQTKKTQLIDQAFSGTAGKGTTTQQKKEARLQDLIQLFGIRKQAEASQRAASQASQPRPGSGSATIID